MLILKLLLVAVSVLLATLAARRFGHAVGGAVAGMPMIAGPITAVLLIDHDAAQVRAIALATLVCLPASIVHIVSFAHAASRVRWPAGLVIALAAYLVAGALLTHLRLPPAAVCLLALAVPSIGLWLAPRGLAAHGPVTVPHSELALRIVAAVAMATAIIVGADTLPASLSGLLLAVPITGSVLPCFTLPRHGAAATASLMRGFIQGLHGFAAFFVTLYLALGSMDRASAFCVALIASLIAALLVQGWRRFVVRLAA
ncbi:MAG: hypothetical protein E6H79_19645 [Betaproteobacteria bacterium]|nr:MAG: hypothetical protein E6H79_19645 [Betaproteobacteria bacterium]